MNVKKIPFVITTAAILMVVINVVVWTVTRWLTTKAVKTLMNAMQQT